MSLRPTVDSWRRNVMNKSLSYDRLDHSRNSLSLQQVTKMRAEPVQKFITALLLFIWKVRATRASRPRSRWWAFCDLIHFYICVCADWRRTRSFYSVVSNGKTQIPFISRNVFIHWLRPWIGSNSVCDHDVFNFTSLTRNAELLKRF